MGRSRDPDWAWLEANADREDVRERIREEIRKGTIRVVPGPGGGIRILPVRNRPPADRGR